MLALVAIWALAEAVLFFIVVDLPIMAVGLRHGWKRALAAALLASVMAALGGVAVAAWAASDPEGLRDLYLSLPGVSPALFDEAVADYAAHGFAAMLLGSLGGTPYKLYAYAAGQVGTVWLAFFAMALAARFPRFALVAIVSGLVGPWLRKRFAPRLIWGVFGLAWVLFYAAYFAALAG